MDVVMFFLTIFFCTTSIALLPGTRVLDFPWDSALFRTPVHKVRMEQIPGETVRPRLACSVGCSCYHGVQVWGALALSAPWPHFLAVFFLTHSPSLPTSEPLLPAVPFPRGSAFHADSHMASRTYHLVAVQMSVLKATFPGHPKTASLAPLVTN